MHMAENLLDPCDALTIVRRQVQGESLQPKFCQQAI